MPRELPVDLIANVLAYACADSRAVARRTWCVSVAWLEAYHGPELWRSLELTDRPSKKQGHCTCAAWARAPERLRRVVEAHTRCVVLSQESYRREPYSLGRGLIGQRFARLELVVIHCQNLNSLQSRDEDEAALRPLFDAEALDIIERCDSNYITDVQLPPDYLRRLISEADGENHRLVRNRPLGSLLDGRNYRLLCQRFTSLRRLRCDSFTPLYPDLSDGRRGLISRGGEDDFPLSTMLVPEQAAQLTEIEGLDLDSFAQQGSTFDNLFPRLTRLTLMDSGTPLQSLPNVFRNCSAACPVLELLILRMDSDQTTWQSVQDYCVFEHTPRSLKALVLILDDVSLPQPRTASAFHHLVKRHAPADVAVHIVTYDVIDDGKLPKGPWASSILPRFGEAYAAADLARPSFTLWPRYMPPPT